MNNPSTTVPRKRSIALLLLLFSILLVSTAVILEYAPESSFIAGLAEHRGNAPELSRLLNRRTPHKAQRRILISKKDGSGSIDLRYLSEEIVEANYFDTRGENTEKIRTRTRHSNLEVRDLFDQSKLLGQVQEVDNGFSINFNDSATVEVQIFRSKGLVSISTRGTISASWRLRYLEDRWVVRQASPKRKLLGRLKFYEKRRKLILHGADNQVIAEARAIEMNPATALLLSDLPLKIKLPLMLEFFKRDFQDMTPA